jgi:hypothetical protein
LGEIGRVNYGKWRKDSEGKDQKLSFSVNNWNRENPLHQKRKSVPNASLYNPRDGRELWLLFFPKYMYESGIPPVFKNINSVRSRGTMRTVFILALIAAVCMCSENVSGTMKLGGGEEDKPSPSAGGETGDSSESDEKRVWSQTDKQIWINFMKSYKVNGKIKLQEIVERARGEPLVNHLNQLPEEQKFFAPDETEAFRQCLCKLLDLELSAENNVIKAIIQRIICIEIIRQCIYDLPAHEDPEVQDEETKGILEFLSKAEARLEDGFRTTSHLSENREGIFKSICKVVRKSRSNSTTTLHIHLSTNPKGSSQKLSDNQGNVNDSIQNK